MTVDANLSERALKLPEDERAELARQLILSLETTEFDSDADTEWEAEIERRAATVDRGEAQLIDWRESVERIRASLQARRSA
jgi:putative addiction module component (TIGR02574 family)